MKVANRLLMLQSVLCNLHGKHKERNYRIPAKGNKKKTAQVAIEIQHKITKDRLKKDTERGRRNGALSVLFTVVSPCWCSSLNPMNKQSRDECKRQNGQVDVNVISHEYI